MRIGSLAMRMAAFRVRGCGGVERWTTWSRKKEATDASLTEGAVASLVVISKQVGRCVSMDVLLHPVPTGFS